MTSSSRPRRRGSSAAPAPIQPAATIWNGSQGPTPAESSPDAKNDNAPRQKPNPGPNTRPPQMMSRKKKVKPVPPPDSGRSAASTPARMPRIATALASRPPSESSANTTARHNGNRATKIHGASLECD